MGALMRPRADADGPAHLPSVPLDLAADDLSGLGQLEKPIGCGPRLRSPSQPTRAIQGLPPQLAVGRQPSLACIPARSRAPGRWAAAGGMMDARCRALGMHLDVTTALTSLKVNPENTDLGI